MNRNERSRKKALSFVILFVFILTQIFTFGIPVQAETIIKAPITLTKTANITSTKVNNEITLNYTIQPGTLNVTPSTQSKEIALVIDTSGSMDTDLQGRDSRLDVAKAAATRFIDKFNTESNVKIGLVQYSNRANKTSGLVDKNSFSTLKDSVKKFTSDGGTNTGDGLRLAYYMLKESSNSNAKKYIVLLTDGEPTFYSYTNYTSNLVTSNIESGYSTNNSNDTTKGLNYADSIATMISGNTSNINSFMIGCTLSTYGTNTLKEIALKAKGTCSFAQTATDIDTVYSQLADQIKNEFPVNSIKFQETLPIGIEIQQVPVGFTVSGQTITGDLGSITYKPVSGTNYTASPLNFQVKVKATNTGVYPLSKDSSGISNSFITYKDIDNTDGKKIFDPVNVTISNPTASINLGRTVDKTNIKVNDKFNITYNIQPQNIPVEDIDPSYEKGSDIVLVMDTSGSMKDPLVNNNSDSKIKVAKDTADSFISKFEGNNNINVALVKFGSTSENVGLKDTGTPLIFANLGDNNQYNYLHAKINSNNVFAPNGGTNIGDGLRIAYHLLNNQGDTSRKKYIILMTDGMPTAFTYNQGTLSYNNANNRNAYGEILDADGRTLDYYSSITRYEYKIDDESNARYVVNYGTDDYNSYSLNYALAMSDIIKNNTTLNIKPIMIAFSSGADVSKLSQIAGRAGGEYKTALSQSDMDSVYTSIAGQIESDFTISGVQFEETFPVGINLQQATMPTGFTVSGQKVTGVLNSISYKLDPTGKLYEPISDPSFSIGNLYSTTAATYNLGQNQTSFISYKDINSEQTKKYFPETSIVIAANTPPDIVATLAPKAGYPDVYSLTVTSKTVSPNKIIKLEEGSVVGSSQKKLWESTTLALTLDQSLVHEFNKSDLIGNTSLYIKVTDSNNNTITETVSLVAVSNIELPDFEQKNGVRPGNINFTTEPNATINSIKVNTKQVVTNQSTGVGSYKCLNVDLIGQNVIDVAITNSYKNTTNMTLKQPVDVTPPVIDANYTFANKKIDANFYTDATKIASENVNLVWLECDLNLDGIITTDEKITVSTDIKNQLKDVQIPDNFQGKDFLVKARELTGNIGSAIPGDKLAPVGTISYVVFDPITKITEDYDPLVIINKNVIATVNFDEPNITITNNGGLATKKFTENGNFTFEFSDQAGNKGTAIATVSNIGKTEIVQHGMFINGAFTKNKSPYAIAKGITGSFGVEFTTPIQNVQIQMKIDSKFPISDLKVYKIIGDGQPIYVSNILVTSRTGNFNVTMPTVAGDITRYILVYKGTVNAAVGDELTNAIKIGSSLDSPCKIQVVKLPDLY